MVTQHFEATLLAMGQILFRVISTDPKTWLPLSIRMQSAPLYRECMVHAAGQYNTKDIQEILPFLPNDSREALMEMAADIINNMQNATSKMLSYYPIPLQRARSVGLVDRDENSRNSYSNDILHWMALMIFRQWLGHQIVLDNTHHAADLGYDFLSQVKAGGSSYLEEVDLTQWHHFFPMSARGRHVIETKLDEIKEHVKRWTVGFFNNTTRLDVEKWPSGYFTCSTFTVERYPWESELKREEESDADDEDSDDSEAMDTDEEGETGSANSVKKEREGEERMGYGDDEFEDELTKMDPERQEAGKVPEEGARERGS